jgi:hypothetical protein
MYNRLITQCFATLSSQYDNKRGKIGNAVLLDVIIFQRRVTFSATIANTFITRTLSLNTTHTNKQFTNQDQQ